MSIHLDTEDSVTVRHLYDTLTGSSYSEPQMRALAAAALTLHQDMTRVTDVLERIASALETRGSI